MSTRGQQKGGRREKKGREMEEKNLNSWLRKPEGKGNQFLADRRGSLVFGGAASTDKNEGGGEQKKKKKKDSETFDGSEGEEIFRPRRGQRFVLNQWHKLNAEHSGEKRS